MRLYPPGVDLGEGIPRTQALISPAPTPEEEVCAGGYGGHAEKESG